jgi:hypothetical protein
LEGKYFTGQENYQGKENFCLIQEHFLWAGKFLPDRKNFANEGKLFS